MKKNAQGVRSIVRGVDSKEFLLSKILRKGAAIILQELLEQKVTEFLGRDSFRLIEVMLNGFLSFFHSQILLKTPFPRILFPLFCISTFDPNAPLTDT